MNAKSAGEQQTESGRIACAGRADCAIPALLDALDATEARADRAEAALQRVRDVLDTWMHRCQTEQTMRALDDVHRALDRHDGDPTTPCGRGPCALGDGHAGDCRM